MLLLHNFIELRALETFCHAMIYSTFKCHGMRGKGGWSVLSLPWGGGSQVEHRSMRRCKQSR